ncbi:hypothetical protein [Rhodococcus sp. Q]|uniref:hypothetical protein n=1 Tax=Rhodococcus sp. Q TaxID=2502252 RepID=UPI0010F766A5|nr:hypothetical protein [Rhodococcus sp. Q]
MSRNLARRGAPVLVAAAVLGGGLALGGGTASAQETDPVFGGSVAEFGQFLADVILPPILAPLGSSEPGSGSAAVGSSEPCQSWVEMGEDSPGCIFSYRYLPTELASLS